MITGCMPEDALQRQIRDELLDPSVYGAKITPEQEEHLLKEGWRWMSRNVMLLSGNFPQTFIRKKNA